MFQFLYGKIVPLCVSSQFIKYSPLILNTCLNVQELEPKHLTLWHLIRLKSLREGRMAF